MQSIQTGSPISLVKRPATNFELMCYPSVNFNLCSRDQSTHDLLVHDIVTHSGLYIYTVFSQFCQQFIRLLFLFQRLAQKIDCLQIPKLLGVGPRSTVSRNLIMLHTLGSAYKRGLQRYGIRIALQHLLTLLDQPFHANTFFAARLDAQVAANLLNALCMDAGLL